MKTCLLAIALLICSTQMIYSQEDDGELSLALPIRNSLKFNRYTLNPTFSFVREQGNYISITNKREWVQFENAPQTYLASFSGRYDENIGVGIGLFQQNYGVLTTFGGILNMAYNIRLQRDSNLTFGMNVGAYKSGLNSGKVVTNFPDPTLENIPSNFLLTINPGINYGTGFMDFGVSINNFALLNTSQVVENTPKKIIQAHMMYTGYTNGAGFFDESRFSGLIRSEFRKDKTVLAGMVMLMVPKGIWAQVGYNNLYGASAGLGLNITKQIAIEYNFEKALGDLTDFGPSHEITLAYKIKNYDNFTYSREDDVSALFSGDNKRKPVSEASKLEAERNRQLAAENKIIAKAEADAKAAETLKLKEEMAAAKLLADAEAKKAAEAKALITAENKAIADAKTKADAESERLASELQAKEVAEAKAKIAAENKAKADVEAAKLAAELKIKEVAEAKAKIEADKKAQAELKLKEAAEAAKLAADLKAKGVADAKARVEAMATAQADAERKAKLTEALRVKIAAEKAAALEAKAKLEAERNAKIAADAKLEADQKAKADEENRLKNEAAAKLAAEQKIQLDAENKAKADAEAAEKLNAEIQAKNKLEADAKAKLVAEAEAKKLAEAKENKAKADAEAAAKLEAEIQAKNKIEADAKAKLEAEAEAKKVAEAKENQAKADAEETAKLEAEIQANKLEADAKAKLEAEAEAKKVAETNNTATVNPSDALGNSMVSIEKLTEASNVAQQELLTRFTQAVANKNQDLKDLKEENDLSDKGIFTEPKPFKSLTEENNALDALKTDLDNAINTRNARIKELETLYEQRSKVRTLENDTVNLYYQKAIKRLKAEQLTAIQNRASLSATLETIKEATEIERKRRIKRAAFDNEQDKYNQDRAALNIMKQNTKLTTVPLNEEDFDFGKEQSKNIQILKNVKNVDNGYYLVLAVHGDVAKRDDFLRKVMASGRTDVDFFYDVNTSEYYIYYQKFDSIENANDALKSKGDRPYNTKLSIVKIEN